MLEKTRDLVPGDLKFKSPDLMLIGCYIFEYLDSPGGSDGKASACSNAGHLGFRLWSNPLEKALEKEMVIHSRILPWKIPDG